MEFHWGKHYAFIYLFIHERIFFFVCSFVEMRSNGYIFELRPKNEDITFDNVTVLLNVSQNASHLHAIDLKQLFASLSRIACIFVSRINSPLLSFFSVHSLCLFIYLGLTTSNERFCEEVDLNNRYFHSFCIVPLSFFNSIMAISHKFNLK